MADDDPVRTLQASLAKEREKSQGNLRKLMAAKKEYKELELKFEALTKSAEAQSSTTVVSATEVEMAVQAAKEEITTKHEQEIVTLRAEVERLAVASEKAASVHQQEVERLSAEAQCGEAPPAICECFFP